MRTVNMIYATHIPKRERKCALRDVYALEPVAPKFNPWSSCPITFDRRDHPTSIRHGGLAALVLDQIIDYPDAEALAAFKHNIRDEWLARHLGQEKPKCMAALTTLMTRFCAGEDSWLACSNNISKNHGTSDTKDGNGRSRRNKHKRRINSDNTEDTTVNAGFKGSKPGQRKKPFNRSTPGPPVWTVYSITRVKYMAPPTSQPTTPTGIVGCSSRPAS